MAIDATSAQKNAKFVSVLESLLKNGTQEAVPQSAIDALNALLSGVNFGGGDVGSVGEGEVAFGGALGVLESSEQLTYDGATLSALNGDLSGSILIDGEQTSIYIDNGLGVNVSLEPGSFDMDGKWNVNGTTGLVYDALLSPAALGATVHDWAASTLSPWCRATSTAGTTITGMAASGAPTEFLVTNIAAPTITFKNANGGSAAPNQILTQSAGDLVLAIQQSARFKYDPTSSRWREIG